MIHVVTNAIYFPELFNGVMTSNSKEPQQKYRLGTVSIKILGGGLNLCYWDLIVSRGKPNEQLFPK